MFLRRLFRKKCQEYKCENPFNTDVDFELLPLRQKVEILRALCDFRLDAEDVEQSLSNLDSDSLRVEPLGHDRKNSAYWYFYGTRLYREDYIDTSDSISHKQKSKPRDKKRKRRRSRVVKEEEEEEEKKEDSSLIHEEGKESVWQVVCFTQQDWSRLVEKFRNSEYDTERKLYRTLSEDFMPEIPKLFDLKEKQQRRKLLQRNSSRVLRSHEPATQMETVMVRSKIKTKTNKGSKKGAQNSKNVYVKEETSPPLSSPPVQKKGRQTNNSLASAVGQIVIHTRDEVEVLEKKKGVGSNSDGNYVSSNYGYKFGYSFGIEEEERRVGMHKVLESLKDHVDAWPFVDPVDEEYAPRYYSVVRKPMDLSTMEEKLDGGLYKNLNDFKRDFCLIVDNCRQYNGSDNEYTEMAVNLKEAFDKAVNRYLESETSSDEDASSPKPFVATPTSPSCPSRVSSPHQNRKRSKKSTKKSKSYKSESKGKSKANDKNDEEEKRGKNYKLPKKKRGKKKSKRVKGEESVNEEEQEEQESEDAMSESSIVTSKRRKHIDANNLLLKTKKLSPKESEELKKMNKKISKERHKQKKEADSVRPIKESKENKKRKEDFEEDYEPLVIAKSKSRKIEKKELEETEIFTNNSKKSKAKKVESNEDEVDALEETDKTQHIKVKKSRKKEKGASKPEEKYEKSRAKDKEKKSKSKIDEPKNGEISSEIDSKDLDLESDLDSKETNTSKKITAFIGDKDIESLDGLKDKISERRREEKLKNEKEKQKKPAKSDLHNVYSKKVPSNGSTFQDSDKAAARRPKLKKGMKEEKVPTTEDALKIQDQEVTETKKVKVAQTKHTKGFGKEESSIQALNQATEQTLHDINKWLDDAPKLSEFSSGSDSPIFHSSVESARSGPKVEAPRKRPSSIKIFGPHGPSRPKKIQRTIDRLQPGKSKGNLLLKKPLNLPNVNVNETAVHQLASDNDQANKIADEEPKLSLGTVLKNVDSIQLICKSLVSSPNPNFSNDDEEEDHNAVPAVPVASSKEDKSSSGKTRAQIPTVAEESKDSQSSVKETQKPKAATPNLSAWFKAFGAPKSKKKDEESEDGAAKKDGELQEVFCGRQRRMSTGGSSVSESVSSFSQESPPGRAGRSPQGQPVMASVEPQIRGAGFYQDALSTGSSPYNSPYYATPPRYSAQLPPTPSPQNHPLSPAYPSSSYEQPPLYSQIPAQQSHPTFQKSPQESSGEVYHQLSPTFPQRSPQPNFPQNSTPSETYNQQLPATAAQNPSPVYSQHSPQPIQQVYPQPSPQPPPSNYSQPSPQQPPTPKYSQPSPQQNAANYSQPSPQASNSNYSQASPQQPHSPYSQPSPQAPPTYSEPSPQQQHSPYAQSPQQSSSYSQLSPQPPSTYSQPSPQPPTVFPQQSQPSNFSQPSPQTHSAGYSQPSPQPITAYSQPSPQPRNYSQPSPQRQIHSCFPQPSPPGPSIFVRRSPQNVSYSQPSPQPPVKYSEPSPQQSVANYSHSIHSPQTPQNYSQLSPQQAPASNYSQPSPTPQQSRNYSQPSPSPQQSRNYSQPSPSPQQSRNYSQPSPQQKSVCTTSQPSQQPTSYSQPSPQQSTNYTHQSQPSSKAVTEDCPQSTATVATATATAAAAAAAAAAVAPPAASSYAQGFKQNHSYIQSPAPPPPPSSSVIETEHRTEYLKATGTTVATEKTSSSEQQRNSFAVAAETSLNLNANHQIYQSPNQYQSAFGNNYPNIDLQRSVSRQEQPQQQQQAPQERSSFADLTESLNAQKYVQQRSFLGKTSSGGDQLSTQDQSQILAFQQNLSAHEQLYPSGFQTSGYPMANSRPVYPSPHYFDAGTKTTSSGSGNSSTSSNLPPVKKRIYNESSTDASRGLTQETATRTGQEQFGFDPIMALSQSDAVSASQFDAAFVGNLADPVATNNAYARLGLGLVGRASKEQQQLLTIPRPPATKSEHLAYARSPAAGAAELDLNLLQSLQTAAAKNTQGILSISRRSGDTLPTGSTAVPAKTRKSRKSKQQQQQEQQNVVNVSSAVSTEPQSATGIPGFPQYTGTSAESISLKNTGMVPPAGSAFNFAASTSTTTSSAFYDKDATAAAFAFLDEFRNPNRYYSMALRQQQQPQHPPVTDSAQQACNKLSNQPPRNYPPHPFLHSAQRSAAYGPPVSAYVTPHGPNLTVDPTAYQQYIHSLYALQPPPHHHRQSWL
ncbi:flocculation protein FLO11-like isoform X2 [Colletes gigas]|nr:flocculation protein FLO11-like isoform X2 [Colletes gigas]